MKRKRGRDWRDFKACAECGAGPAEPCLNLLSLRSHVGWRTPVDNPHKGRINAGTDQTPPPPVPPECPAMHPYFRNTQCQMGAHDGDTHVCHDRGMGTVVWHTTTEENP